MTADIKTEAAKPWYHGVKWARSGQSAIVSSNGHVVIHSVAVATCGRIGDYYECARPQHSDYLQSNYWDFILAAPETATERDLLKARVAEADQIIEGLWRYALITQPVEGVVYPEGTHYDFVRRAAVYLNGSASSALGGEHG